MADGGPRAQLASQATCNDVVSSVNVHTYNTTLRNFSIIMLY